MLKNLVMNATKDKRRLVAPLMGLPGLKKTGSTIKLSQQNYAEHFNAIRALYEEFTPDMLFPLMDITLEANAMGAYTIFPKDDSPTVFDNEFTLSELEKRKHIQFEYDARIRCYLETVALMKVNLPSDVLRGAYVTGPYTLAAIMIGAEEAAISTLTKPDELTTICEIVTEKIREMVQLLIAAGTQVICILEPNAVMLGPDHFERFSADYVKSIVSLCHSSNIDVIYHICGKSTHLIDKMITSGVNAISLDSTWAGVNLPQVAEQFGDRTILIGNINPIGHLLYSTPQMVEQEVKTLLEKMDGYPNYILSTGCDLPQNTPLDNIHAMMRAGRSHRIK